MDNRPVDVTLVIKGLPGEDSSGRESRRKCGLETNCFCLLYVSTLPNVFRYRELREQR